VSSKITRLISAYSKFISIPWRNAAAAQRVVFCIYDKNEELNIRARIDEFEIATHQAGHDWAIFDLTDTFAEWLSMQRYSKKYYEQPELLSTLISKYLPFIRQEFDDFLSRVNAGENYVVALKGVGSVFGFLKVKEIVDEVAPLVSGRLLIFFPGSYENNNYKLLDGYDGWNYLAVPITADKEL